jgi:hypothetical protein
MISSVFLIDRRLWGRVILLLFVTVTLGCNGAYVKDYPVENNVSESTADLKGTQKSVLEYFEDKYPPDRWDPAQITSRIAVGPILISREAMLFLERDSSIKGDQVASGVGSNAVVKNHKGQTLYFLAKKESYSAQAVVTEVLTNEKDLRVYSLDRDVSEALQSGKMSYKKLLGDGIRYLVSGNLTVNEGSPDISVYLRLIDTATMKILCATSARGGSVEDVSRNAAHIMLARLAKK